MTYALLQDTTNHGPTIAEDVLQVKTVILLTCISLCLQVGQTAEALNAARAEVESAEKEAMAVKKKADDLTAAAGRKSAEADNYRDKWEKMKEQVSVAKSAEREHWERAKKVRLDIFNCTTSRFWCPAYLQIACCRCSSCEG